MSAGKAAAPGAPAAGRAPRKKEPSPLELLKLQIAEELGLGDKVRREGWAMLTAAESGRLGGVLNRKLKEMGLTPGPRGILQAR